MISLAKECVYDDCDEEINEDLEDQQIEYDEEEVGVKGRSAAFWLPI